MKTQRFETKDIEHIANLLFDGKVVAFPTDTVYGVGVIYGNETALDALKASKDRDDKKPIPVMVSSVQQIESLAHLNDFARTLIEEFMPGGITLILRKRSKVPSFVTDGLDTIAIRMPDDDNVMHLIDLCEQPLMVTSANLSGLDTGEDGDEVLEQLDGRIHGIVMGKCKGNKASTIVDCTKEYPIVIREGDISEKEINEALEYAR